MSWRVVKEGTTEEVPMGSILTSARGVRYKLLGLKPPMPRLPSSTGRVIVQTEDMLMEGTFSPCVFFVDVVWIDDGKDN